MTTTYAEARKSATSRTYAFEMQAKAAMQFGEIMTPQSSGGMFSDAGSRKERESYALFRNWVYTAANLIAKRLASQPVHAGEIVNAPENPERRAVTSLKNELLRSKLPSRIYQKAVVDQELEILPTHPVIDTICRPNPIQKKFEFLYFSAVNLLITGQAYWIGGAVRDKEGERVEMWAIPSSWVQPIHEGGLFSKYKIKPAGQHEGFELDPENVARTYFADPSDPKGSLSPLRGILAAIRTDDYIQTSQQQMFERGLNPNLIVTIGKEPDREGKERRPWLTGEQRRQFIRGIREMWSRQVNAGDPAILDGMIESVHKMHLTPQEMDFITSSDLVKRRIFQAFSINPISAGENVGTNRAQATEAEKQLCISAINPVLDAFSETMTDFLGPMYDSPERLVVWIEPCEPKDPDLEIKRWQTALTNDVVTDGEYRVHVLGLEAGDEKLERNVLLSTVGGMTGSVQILTAMGQGLIGRDAARNVLQLFLELDDDVAEALVGEEFTEEAPALPAPPPKPPAEEPEDVIADDATEINEEVRRATGILSASVQGTLDAMNDTNQMMQEALNPSQEEIIPKEHAVPALLPGEVKHHMPRPEGYQIQEKTVRQFLEVLHSSMFEALQGPVIEALKQPVIDAYQNSILTEQKDAIMDLSSALSQPKQPINISVLPAPVQVTNENEINVNVPEVNVVVTPIPGPVGPIGPAGPKGEMGEPSEVNVNIERPDAPSSAQIRHSDGTISTVSLGDTDGEVTPT